MTSFDSPLAWGTGSSFGQISSDDQALSLIETCLRNGIRRFDTGASYAMGRSESLLGSCLKRIGVDRSSLILSTKIGSLPPAKFWGPTLKDFSPDTTIRLLMRSLENLQTEYIDIVFFHSLPSDRDSCGLALEVLGSFKHEGRIRSIGVSAHSVDELQWLVCNHEQFDVLMTHYNPLVAARSEPYLRDLANKGLLIYGSAPFASGLLYRKRDLLDLSRPHSSCFKIARNYKRALHLDADSQLLLQMCRDKVANGLIDPLSFSLESDVVDVTVFGSLSRSKVESYCDLASRLST